MAPRASAVRTEAEEALGELVAQLRSEALAPAHTAAEQKARTDARRLLIEATAALRRADRPARTALETRRPKSDFPPATGRVDLPPLTEG